MRIIYAVNSCSNRVYQQLFAHAKKKPAYHSQKYHRLVMEGLAAHTQVEAVVTPPVNRSVMEKAYVSLPDEWEGGVHYTYLPAIRSPYLKLPVMALGTFFKTLFRAKKDTAVVVDCLNGTVGVCAMAAARIRRVPCVCIVTDLPEMLGMSSVSRRLIDFTIRHSTHYILLTEAMAERLRVKHKPYVVLEGQSDIAMQTLPPSREQKRKPRICMYAGSLYKIYGIGNLIEGFRMAKLENVQLHLYGPCNFEEELRQIAREEPNIFYGGMVLNTEIVEKEMEATLLVNPRPTDEEFVKYSFPSKTMEYMSTGTPVLTTVLPGMPREYYPHVYLLEDETPEGIARKLRELFALTDEELFQKGCEARNFILNEKNNVIQAGKILDMLEK